MLTKIMVIAATGISAVSAACQQAALTQFANNPVTAPSTATYPTIGEPFNIEWDDTGMGPTVTLYLLSGCPGNCVMAATIVAGAPNTGVYAWTPDCTLAADTTTEGYGIEMVDDTLCKFQYSFNFGLHAGTCAAAASSGASAASTATAASAAASSGASSPTSAATVVKTSKASVVSTATSATAPPMTLTTAKKTSTAGGSASASASASGTSSASGTFRVNGIDRVLGAAMAFVTVFAVALML